MLWSRKGTVGFSFLHPLNIAFGTLVFADIHCIFFSDQAPLPPPLKGPFTRTTTESWEKNYWFPLSLSLSLFLCHSVSQSTSGEDWGRGSWIITHRGWKAWRALIDMFFLSLSLSLPCSSTYLQSTFDIVKISLRTNFCLITCWQSTFDTRNFQIGDAFSCFTCIESRLY